MIRPLVLSMLAFASLSNACLPDSKEMTIGHHPMHKVCVPLDTGGRNVSCQLKTLAVDGVDVSFDLGVAYVSPTHAESQVRGPNFPAQGHIDRYDGKQGSTDYLFGEIAPSLDFAQNGTFDADFHAYSDKVPHFHAAYQNGHVIVSEDGRELGRGTCTESFRRY